MKLYYFANHIYQFSYALPVYDKLGGIFVVREKKRLKQFRKYLKNRARFGEKTINNTPEVIVCERRDAHKLEGIIFYLSNSIMPKDDYSKSITIFHEHGTSDKRYGNGKDSAPRKLAKYDYIFLSGPKNKERLKEIDLEIPEEKQIQIGGLRFDQYLDGSINKDEEMNRLGIQDRSRKTILYAPTWSFGNGTFKKYALKFAKEITKEHNLIIRPHYHDRAYGIYVKIMAKLLGIKHVYLSQAANLIKSDTLRDFIVSDLMISDVSSVIYEYLITKNPMIIAQNDFEDRHEMPDDLNIMKHVDIYSGNKNILEMVNENITSQKYRENYIHLLKNCFYSTEGGCVDKSVNFIKNLMNK